MTRWTRASSAPSLAHSKATCAAQPERLIGGERIGGFQRDQHPERQRRAWGMASSRRIRDFSFTAAQS
jgi:hypothetical protein